MVTLKFKNSFVVKVSHYKFSEVILPILTRTPSLPKKTLGHSNLVKSQSAMVNSYYWSQMQYSFRVLRSKQYPNLSTIATVHSVGVYGWLPDGSVSQLAKAMVGSDLDVTPFFGQFCHPCVFS